MKHDAAQDNFEPIEADFFARGQRGALQPEWEPAALPRQTRLVIGATLGMLALAGVGFAAFVIHSVLVLPAPEPLGASVSLPDMPPVAATRAATRTGLPEHTAEQERSATARPASEAESSPANRQAEATPLPPSAAESGRPSSS